MYYAMDEIGRDNCQIMRSLSDAGDKWRLIDELAQQAGFFGIHVSKDRYEKDYLLPLATIPEEMRRYRLTIHLDRPYSLVEDDECRRVWHWLDSALSFAKSVNAKSVSICPPSIPTGMQPMRGYLRERFLEVISAISGEYRWTGVGLSIRSDTMGREALFQGLADYVDFINEVRIGALVDLSSLFYQGYSVNDLLEALDRTTVAGFYVSDAFPGKDAAEGMRLPVGDGLMGLERILAKYARRDDVFGALSVDANFEEIRESLRKVMAFRHDI